MNTKGEAESLRLGRVGKEGRQRKDSSFGNALILFLQSIPLGTDISIYTHTQRTLGIFMVPCVVACAFPLLFVNAWRLCVSR
jgi:hypothetical protein